MLNLIPNARTEEETKALPTAGNNLQELIAEKMSFVVNKSDAELSEMVKDFSDYPLQQAAARELRGRTPAKRYSDSDVSEWELR